MDGRVQHERDAEGHEGEDGQHQVEDFGGLGARKLERDGGEEGEEDLHLAQLREDVRAVLDEGVDGGVHAKGDEADEQPEDELLRRAGRVEPHGHADERELAHALEDLEPEDARAVARDELCLLYTSPSPRDS